MKLPVSRFKFDVWKHAGAPLCSESCTSGSVKEAFLTAIELCFRISELAWLQSKTMRFQRHGFIPKAIVARFPTPHVDLQHNTRPLWPNPSLQRPLGPQHPLCLLPSTVSSCTETTQRTHLSVFFQVQPEIRKCRKWHWNKKHNAGRIFLAFWGQRLSTYLSQTNQGGQVGCEPAHGPPPRHPAERKGEVGGEKLSRSKISTQN